jgi:hypothetical protein
MSLLQLADLLNEDSLLVRDKSLLTFNLHGDYLSAILTMATKEDLESEMQHIPAILEKFSLFNEHSHEHTIGNYTIV